MTGRSSLGAPTPSDQGWRTRYGAGAVPFVPGADARSGPIPAHGLTSLKKTASRQARDGAWVAEPAGDVLKGRPNGMRLIVRKERPHPGARSRFTDADGIRPTCFATDTADTATATLELRHRQRARGREVARDGVRLRLPVR